MNDNQNNILEAQRKVTETLYELDPETQMHELRISFFLLKHPELVGISYASADLLVTEKNSQVQAAAIKQVAKDLQHYIDVAATGSNRIPRKVTDNQVRRILRDERLKQNPTTKTRKPKNAEITLDCPCCDRKISYKRDTRNKIVAFRVTKKTDNAIDFISRECGVSRSFFVEKLLQMEKRFGSVTV